jgi:hypothetical protein
VNIYIKKDTPYYFPINYLLKIIEKNKNVSFTITEKEVADILFDHTDSRSQPIAISFYKNLLHKESVFSNSICFKDSLAIYTESGEPDMLATVFYMINCMQELNPMANDTDRFGRFKYEASYQKRFNSIENNLVQKSIDVLCEKWKVKNAKNFKSAFFISHDIDTIYGSLFQDGLWALKKGRIDIILSIIFHEFIRNPHWRNIDKIIKLNSDHDIRSTFFWLVNKGMGELNIKNADYAIQKEADLLKLIDRSGFCVGLHKSCSPMEFNEELNKLPVDSTFNRYHFLKFLPHTDWQKISDSKIHFDSSLGFAERYGFRNSFGMPFQPYDFFAKKAYDFMEAPLNFMDGTFHKYMKIPTGETAGRIIDFYEANNENCIFSLCWHNTYFTNYKYKGYLDQYKKLLTYICEKKIECLTPDQIINKFWIS